MSRNAEQTTRDLLQFIQNSPTCFQAVGSIAALLDGQGYTRLHENAAWTLEPQGKYYVVRNASSVIAFALPDDPAGFMIAAAHTDSPTFKLKENFEIAGPHYLRLDTERYGGMIMSSWMDRPLSVAGRVTVKTPQGIRAQSVVVDRDLCLIPSVAIHFNRSVNDGYTYNPAVDLVPLYADGEGAGALKREVAAAAGVTAEQIASMDLFLYNRTPGALWGAHGEYFSAPRIDNLGCTFAALSGLLASSRNTNAVKVFAAFDNEETGSATKQGAGSVFLRDTLSRICEAFGKDLRVLSADSMMVSADNGHAGHPNHPELSDAQNAPVMNGGVVIKTNAAQKYTTDAVSSALFEEICARAGVPVQRFANRSDIAGGSTLGSISDTFVPMITVDVGMAQLAMHSAYETAGTADTAYMTKALTAFFDTEIVTNGDSITILSK